MQHFPTQLVKRKFMLPRQQHWLSGCCRVKMVRYSAMGLQGHNETVRDLLSPGRPLVLREDKQMVGLEQSIGELKIIHVAGTKGKGSTCTFSEAILRECGLRTGLLTSPHLIDVRERIRINRSNYLRNC